MVWHQCWLLWKLDRFQMEDSMGILQEKQLFVFWFEYNEEGNKLLYTLQSIFKVLRVAYS